MDGGSSRQAHHADRLSVQAIGLGRSQTRKGLRAGGAIDIFAAGT